MTTLTEKLSFAAFQGFKNDVDVKYWLHYDTPTGKTDAIAMQRDVDYSVCKGDKKFKNKADRKMVKDLRCGSLE